MIINDSEEPLTEENINFFERELALQFPLSLREHFLRANGGRPDLNVYEYDNVDTDVSEFLPLRYGRGSAISVYQNHVLSKGFVPRHFFPFAVDGGGDYFYVDCSTEDGMVYLYRHDTAFEHIVPLNVGIDEFCSRLKPDA